MTILKVLTANQISKQYRIIISIESEKRLTKICSRVLLGIKDLPDDLKQKSLFSLKKRLFVSA
ncbi:MAG: hypothetical protein Q8S39_12075, partial [Ignavibacteria bacterium]|nr:hypothetical protein [Ignavibacteria bacterium]